MHGRPRGRHRLDTRYAMLAAIQENVRLIEPMIRAWSPSKLRSTKCLKAIL